MDIRKFERRVVVSSRFFAILAVFGSLAGALLMFLLGLFNVYEAFHEMFEPIADSEAPFGTDAVIRIIEGLDRFLIAIVLIYFSYGVYSLFIHPEESEEALALPVWLRVHQIGQLKQVVAEVIIVILFVLFLRVALQSFQNPQTMLDWLQIAKFLVLPFSIVMLALALRFVELHPKPPRVPPKTEPDDVKLRQGDQDANTTASR
ncbi:MAG: YqhA family protein [Reyranellaceae bacterium]